MSAIPHATVIAGPAAVRAVAVLLALASILADGCSQQTALILSTSGRDPSDVVAIKPDQCLWYRPDEQHLRLLIQQQRLGHAGQIILDGLDTSQFILVIDLPCPRGDSAGAMSDLGPANLRGLDLTSSRLGYFVARDGSITWRLGADGLLTGSFQSTCVAYPPRLHPEHRLADRFVLTGRFAARHDPDAARPAAQQVLWSLEREPR